MGYYKHPLPRTPTCLRPSATKKRLLSAVYNTDDIDSELDMLLALKEDLATKTNDAHWINVFEPEEAIKPFQ